MAGFEGMRLGGRVLKVEQNQTRDGSRTWMTVFVLADTEVHECSLARSYNGPIPAKGDEAVWPVSVRPGKRAGGDVVLYVDILGEGIVDEDSPAGSRALSSVG